MLGQNFLGRQLNSYAVSSTQELFGSQSLASEQEDKIRIIATKMSVSAPFLVRRMNHAALSSFGYHNAFAYFPSLLTFIPIGNQPFLFVSEGFFEDLSFEEQEFLIGHEIAHIKEQHTRCLHLMMYSFELLLFLIGWIIFSRYIKPFIKRRCADNYRIAFLTSSLCILVSICALIPTLIQNAYLRHIERVADHESLTTLNSYAGCIKLINRWQKEWNLPSHNLYLGLFADHPSCHERKTYCHLLQTKQRDIV